MISTTERSTDTRRARPQARALAAPVRTEPARIGLIDDHAAVAIAVRAALERTSELCLVTSATTVDGLRSTCRDMPEIVVLDLRLADGTSPATNVERLTAAGSQVLAYTSGESRYLLREVARTGVLGIVRKSEPLSALPAALLDIVRGHPRMDLTWAATVSDDPRTVNAKLSKHEQRIVSLFADGYTAQAVADTAGIALSTVEDYIRRIRAKYATAGRPAVTKVDLYKRAIEDGFLPTPTAPAR